MSLDTNPTELVSAQEANQIAQTAEVTHQLMAVAYAINSAANTGELCTLFNQPLLPEVRAELISKGYRVISAGIANPSNITRISWEDADVQAEPQKEQVYEEPQPEPEDVVEDNPPVKSSKKG